MGITYDILKEPFTLVHMQGIKRWEKEAHVCGGGRKDIREGTLAQIPMSTVGSR